MHHLGMIVLTLLGSMLLPVATLGVEILAYAIRITGMMAWETKGWRGLAVLVGLAILFFPLTLAICLLAVLLFGAVALIERRQRETA